MNDIVYSCPRCDLPMEKFFRAGVRQSKNLMCKSCGLRTPEFVIFSEAGRWLHENSEMIKASPNQKRFYIPKESQIFRTSDPVRLALYGSNEG